MVKVPKDIQQNIIKLSKVVGEDKKELVKRLQEILKDDESIQDMDKPEFKIRYAWAVLYREYSGRGEPYFIMPISAPRPRRVEIKGELTWVGDLVALIQKIETDENGEIVDLGDVKYGAGTFWRNAAKNMRSLEPHKVYKAHLKANDNKWGASISSNVTSYKEAKDDDHSIPSFEKFYETEIPASPITIGSMDMNISKYDTDIKVVEVTVMDASVGESAKGNEFGRYAIADDSIMGADFGIFVAPEDVEWAQGSILKFGGIITEDKDSGRVTWKNHFIIPTELAIPKQVEVKSVSNKDAVDINEEEPEEQEETEEPKEEESEEPEETKEETKEEKESEESEEESGDDVFKVDT